MITYIITFPLPCSQVPQLCTPGRHPPHIGDKPSRPQAQGRVLPGAYRRRARFKSGAASIIYLRGGQPLRTYQVRYKQFPRSRRSIRTLHIEADSLQNARINFLKAINLMKKLQHYTPFWCDHICIVDTWEVASNG